VRDGVSPLSADLEAAVRLGRAAALARPWVGEHGTSLADRLDADVRAGSRVGALYWRSGRPVGIATWHPAGPLGVSVDLYYLDPAAASPEEFAHLWRALRALAGPIAFLAGEIAGLTPEDEARLFGGVGLRRFGRSEMRRPDSASAVPEPPVPDGGKLRPVGPDDTPALSELHRQAYHGRLDRYLFLEDEDEARDAQRMCADLFVGRWGEFLPEGSRGIELDGGLIAAVLSVRRPDGVLIADVMVDPARQGRGWGEVVMRGTLAALSAAEIGSVFLNVTEGNGRAVRLYERLGFVRTLGPSVDWYDPAIVPATD